jgi:hypothetical protein
MIPTELGTKKSMPVDKGVVYGKSIYFSIRIINFHKPTPLSLPPK